MQKRIGELARRYDMAVCGPNSEGFLSAQARPLPDVQPRGSRQLEVPLLPERAAARVAVVSQSGGIGFSFFDRGRPRRIPFSHVVTTGNEAGARVLRRRRLPARRGKRRRVHAVPRDVRNAATFRRAAAKALQDGQADHRRERSGAAKPGGGPAASHTAALAGEYEVYRAMFRRYGIIEGADIEQMVDIAAAFSIYRERLPAGKRVGIVTGIRRRRRLDRGCVRRRRSRSPRARRRDPQPHRRAHSVVRHVAESGRLHRAGRCGSSATASSRASSVRLSASTR
jgi:acyl-CoA synthetase (NDP forming)